MNRTSSFAGATAAVVVALGLGIVVVSNRQNPKTPAVQPESGSAALAPASVAAPNESGQANEHGAKATLQPAASEGTPSEKVATANATRARAVRVSAANGLATVNEVVVTLKDLVPGSGSDPGAEQTMTPEMYNFLLDHAIERELIFQAARAKGVELTEDQQRQREQVRQTLLARHGEQDGKVAQLNVSGTLEDQIQFELREATSQLLLNSLLAKEGLPSPYVTDGQVQEFYQSHVDLYGALPATEAQRASAWQRIDYEIRQKLAPTVQAEYAEALRRYFSQLKAKAKVTL